MRDILGYITMPNRDRSLALDVVCGETVPLRVGPHQLKLLYQLRSLPFYELRPCQRDAGWNAIVRDEHHNPFRGFGVVSYFGKGRYIGYLAGGVPHGTGVKVMTVTKEGQPTISCQVGHFEKGMFGHSQNGAFQRIKNHISLRGELKSMRD